MNANAFLMSLLPEAACLPASFNRIRSVYHPQLLVAGILFAFCQESCLQSLGSERLSDFLKFTQHVGQKSVLNQSLVIFPRYPDCAPRTCGSSATCLTPLGLSLLIHEVG